MNKIDEIEKEIEELKQLRRSKIIDMQLCLIVIIAMLWLIIFTLK